MCNLGPSLQAYKKQKFDWTDNNHAPLVSFNCHATFYNTIRDAYLWQIIVDA